MHTLEFNFHTVTSEQAIDALVYAHSVTLWLKHSIDSYQSIDSQPSALFLVMFTVIDITGPCTATIYL